jgi:hypothetical protein
LPPARSICANSQPPKISPFALASAGIAITRTSGAVAGNSRGDRCGALSLVEFITLRPPLKTL